MKGKKGSNKISGRNKNSWRRVDVTDLEDYIDDKLLQERLGTDFESKPDDELFVVDTKPLDERTNKQKSKGRLTKLQRRSLLLKEEPACFRALVNESKVPDPSGKRNHTKPVTLSRRTIEKKIKSGILQKKLDNVRFNRELHRQKVQESKESRFGFQKDLWNEEDLQTKTAKQPFTEWLSKDSLICNNLKLKKKIISRKKITVPSVSLPHEGTSYNPTYKAHQELLKNVVDDELKVIKEEKHIERVTSQMFRRVTRRELEKEHMEQLMEGLNEKVSDTENNDEGGEYISINPPVKNKKKDLKTRRHIKEHKSEKAKAKQEAIEKKKIADIYKLRFIKNDVTERETSLKTKKLSRMAKKANTIKLPQISSKPFKEPSPIFQSSEDLSGNLRNLKPQGGGLPEHFVSLQRRGIASVSKPITRKKAATKRYKLSTHRLPWEQIERPVKSSKKKMEL